MADGLTGKLRAALAALALWGGTAHAAVPSYTVEELPGGSRPPHCRLRFTYSDGELETKVSVLEQRGSWFGAAISTNDRRLFGQTVVVSIDGEEMLRMHVGRTPLRGGLRGGVLLTPEASGRALVEPLLKAAGTAKAVTFRATGLELPLPAAGLKEAAQDYARCREVRRS
jgi:hypothetical protein